MKRSDISKPKSRKYLKAQRLRLSETELMLVELPSLATVVSLDQTQNLGFVQIESNEERHSVHLEFALNGRRDFSDVKEDDRLLCQLGTRPERPGELAVVRWAMAKDLDWSDRPQPRFQNELDAMRSGILRSLSTDQFHRKLSAAWYCKQWGGNAPADLSDPVLGKIWIKRLSKLNPRAVKNYRFRERVKSCRFDAARQVDPANPFCSVDVLLKELSPAQLAALGAPRREWLLPQRTQYRQTAEELRPRETSDRELSNDQKSAILDWFLLCSISEKTDQDYDEWLIGCHDYEATTARRLLDHGEHYPPMAVRFWIATLADNGLISQKYVDRLVDHDPLAAIRDLERLSAKRSCRPPARTIEKSLRSAIEKHSGFAINVVLQSALSIDLETDGDRIREIGCAGKDFSSRLHDEAQDTDIDEAFEKLAGYMRHAKIIVGHNILTWDWPTLDERMTTPSQPLVWDTLLVQYVLDPRAETHALGGTHRAEADAEAALELFAKQLTDLPAAIVAKLVTGQLCDTGELYKAVIDSTQDTLSLCRPLPRALRDPGHQPPRVLLQPETSLRIADWVPRVALIHLDPLGQLPKPYWQIDKERLKEELTEEQKRAPVSQVLLALANKALEEDIALRPSMLPPWLLKALPEMSAAIDRSCFIPDGRDKICISPFPDSKEWWANADTSSLRTLLPNNSSIVLDRKSLSGEMVEGSFTRVNCNLAKVKEGFAHRWVLRDRPAQILEFNGGWWRGFRTIKVPESLTIDVEPSGPAHGRPILAKRQHQALLFPGSRDQATYWTDLLKDFEEILTADTTSVLLIVSTTSSEMLDLLEMAFEEVGLGEIRPAHRSRREHLLRAKKHGFAVVDSICNWQAWRSIAELEEYPLQLVIEALPVEEWFALADADQCEKPSSDEESNDVVQHEARDVSEAMILETLPHLTKRFLDPWLLQLELDSGDHPVIILDRRAGEVSRQLKANVDQLQLSGNPWSDEKHIGLKTVFSPLQIERKSARSDFATMEKFLVANWQPADGYDAKPVDGFKQSQTMAMESIGPRTHDVMVTLPTGEGKSVLFQVPALCRGLRNRRLTLVLSPLKALMRDQVDRLCRQGFAESVDYINSDRPWFELTDVLQGLLDHRIALLYVAPERLRNAKFRDVLRRRIEADGGLEYVVFDEAHCIGQWGYEFRPDYLYAFGLLLQKAWAGDPSDLTPFLMLSATLTAVDRTRLQGLLEGGSRESPRLPLMVCPDPKEVLQPLQPFIDVEPLKVRGNILVKREFETALTDRLPEILKVIDKALSSRKETDQRSAVVVFATRVAHCDDLARRLAIEANCEVESYHAGLDGATREDIEDRFRKGDLDVLVATKAFGMGMDIPDIHWVVHLSPPTYLEDYLQEVGRMGRGAVERERAGLRRLSAIMLASDADFEKMRSIRAENELQTPQIDEIENEIVSSAEIIDGQLIAIVPQNGFKPFKSWAEMRANRTQLRMAMFWLEKAGHLEQLGMVPDLLTVELVPKKLSAIANEESLHGEVARAILSLLSGEEDRSSHHELSVLESGDDGFLGEILDLLSDTIGIGIKATSQTNTRRTSDAENALANSGSKIPTKAVINLAQLRRQCGIKNLDATMSCLVDLHSRGGLKLSWKLEFARRPLLEEPTKCLKRLILTIVRGVKGLVRKIETQGAVQFDPLQMLDESDWGLDDPDAGVAQSHLEEAEQEQRRLRYRRAYEQGFRSLARACGIRLWLSVNEVDERVYLKAELPKAKLRQVKSECDKFKALARILMSLFKEADDRKRSVVEVRKLIRNVRAAHPREEFSVADFEATLRLLSAMRLISAHPRLIPLSYVLVLKSVPQGLEQHPELVDELNGVNELAETRMFAMEVFANLPQRARGTFIEGYFRQENTAALKDFVESQLGEIEEDGEGASGFIARKREQLRATQVANYFADFKQSDEPAQWDVIRHPYDRHLLVNAGPGAGKTSVLVGRIVHLIREQHVKPWEIVVLAFNRAVVFEIRKRVRDRFESLGYAAYASQVRVSTFHAFANRNLANADEQNESSEWEQLLPDFAALLENDQSFRQQVAGDCRCIMIDEFQDVTEDVYSIICNLHRGSGERAGVMVVGDDDQDILRWIRVGKKEKDEFAEIYFRRFQDEFGGENLDTVNLKVNFRSGAEIVRKSQSMISDVFRSNTASRRLKTFSLSKAPMADEGLFERHDARRWPWNKTVERVRMECLRLQVENPGSLAILCHTNGDVASIRRELHEDFPSMSVYNSENMRVSHLRHVALWIEFLQVEVARQDRPLTDQLRRDLIKSFCQTDSFSEADSEELVEGDLTDLWQLCMEESVFPHLSTLVRFITQLKSDELVRLLGRSQNQNEVVVSTIHKVKGLEFDNVVIVPSRGHFGKNNASEAALKNDAAEEARLLYVAMTRAKTRLVKFVGDREYTWARKKPMAFEGRHGQGKILNTQISI